MGTPQQPVWTGDANLPPDARGLMILGTPHGHPDYVARLLLELSRDHRRLLDAINDLPELQSAWLVLSLCASTRSNYYLLALPPSLSAQFANWHDEAMRLALLRLLRMLLPPENADKRQRVLGDYAGCSSHSSTPCGQLVAVSRREMAVCSDQSAVLCCNIPRLRRAAH